MRITSQELDTLVKGTSFFQELIDIQNGDTVRQKAYAASNSFGSDKGVPVYSWVDSTSYCVTTFKAYFDPSGEEIKINTKSLYKKDVQVIREAMVVKMAQPVMEVYRKNTLIDTANFQSEYWLNKEGVRFGSGKNTLIV